MNDFLDDLRAEYLTQSFSRIETMRALLERLMCDAADIDALLELERHFHSLSGMGATYGFPRVSSIGHKGEIAASRLIRRGKTPAPSELRRWRALIKKLPAAFVAH